jgi:hypothetical protein
VRLRRPTQRRRLAGAPLDKSEQAAGFPESLRSNQKGSNFSVCIQLVEGIFAYVQNLAGVLGR